MRVPFALWVPIRMPYIKAAYELLHDEAAYKTMSNSVNPYGDGKASERILQALRHEFLGDANRPNRFGK